jgi:hypothetical protein
MALDKAIKNVISKGIIRNNSILKRIKNNSSLIGNKKAEEVVV